MTSPIHFTLRRSKEGEAPALFPIHRAAFAALVDQGGGLDEETWRAGFIAGFNPKETLIIEVADKAAGWIHINRQPNEWFLKEVVVAPELQGRGLGTSLMQQVMGQAQKASAALTLSVYRKNKAVELYRRLGFETYASDPTRIWMVHDPDRRAPLDVRLVRATMRRGTSHRLRLRDGGAWTGQILAVEQRQVSLLPEPCGEPLQLSVDRIELQSLSYNDDGWVKITAMSSDAGTTEGEAKSHQE